MNKFQTNYRDLYKSLHYAQPEYTLSKNLNSSTKKKLNIFYQKTKFNIKALALASIKKTSTNNIYIGSSRENIETN